MAHIPPPPPDAVLLLKVQLITVGLPELFSIPAPLLCGEEPLECIMKKRAKIFGNYTPYKHIAFQVFEKFGRSAKWLLFKKEKKDIAKELNQ